MHQTVVMFGQTEKGVYHTSYLCKNLMELEGCLGTPPENTLGMHLAIQALLFKKEVLYFKVEEEGFSSEDYYFGLSRLENHALLPNIIALGLPGVGDKRIIEISSRLCLCHHLLLITTEADLYDYLTDQ